MKKWHTYLCDSSDSDSSDSSDRSESSVSNMFFSTIFFSHKKLGTFFLVQNRRRKIEILRRHLHMVYDNFELRPQNQN